MLKCCKTMFDRQSAIIDVEENVLEQLTLATNSLTVLLETFFGVK